MPVGIAGVGATKQAIRGSVVMSSLVSVGERGDLDRVVAEHAPAAPGSCALEPAQTCPSPSVLALQRGDATLRAGAPLHEFDEAVAGLDLLAGFAGLTLAEDRDEFHTEFGEFVVD